MFIRKKNIVIYQSSISRTVQGDSARTMSSASFGKKPDLFIVYRKWFGLIADFQARADVGWPTLTVSDFKMVIGWDNWTEEDITAQCLMNFCYTQAWRSNGIPFNAMKAYYFLGLWKNLGLCSTASTPCNKPLEISRGCQAVTCQKSVNSLNRKPFWWGKFLRSRRV